MDKFCYSAGIVALIISLVVQYVKINLTKLQGSREEKKPFLDEVVLLRLMGILWIILGGIIALVKDWFKSSFLGAIVQGFLIFIPIFLFRVIIWFKDKNQSDGEKL